MNRIGKESEEQISYRELAAKDFMELFKLVKNVASDSPEAMTTDISGEAAFMDIFTKKLSGMYSGNLIDLVAESRGCIIGECEAVIDASNSIIGILVDKRYRRSGIGSELLNSIMPKLQKIGVRNLIAEVADENKGTIRFFLQNGFSVAGSYEKEIYNQKIKVVWLLRKIHVEL
jgi:RimJ/RimL family protein N-acetyltransferase